MDSKTTSTSAPVLISGAGPTGLLFSIWLTRYGVAHRIVDKAPEAGQGSRAIVTHARTLEQYRALGLAEEFLREGTPVESLGVLWGGEFKPVVHRGKMGVGLSKFPFLLSITQDDHERLLERWLERHGRRVERGVEVVGVDAPAGGGDATVRLRRVDGGGEETITASFVIGADGAHSGVRHAIGVRMPGGTYERSFYVADVMYSGSISTANQLSICLTNQELGLIMPLPRRQNRARLNGIVPDGLDASGQEITFENATPGFRRYAPGVTVDKINWFTTYKVHHRCAANFQYGSRIFLCGDSAHLHSPAGGQGMNTGLGDSTNLAWKIATVWHGRTADSDALLGSYEKERLPFAQKLVKTTDAAFQIMASPGFMGWFMRNILYPYVVPFLSATFNLSGLLFRKISQIGISYPDSSLSQGGRLGGARLPYVELPDNIADVDDNHAVLDASGWQAHVFGDVPPVVEKELDLLDVPLKTFPWVRKAGKVGFVRGTVYLVRPDAYVGLVLSDPGSDKALATLRQYGAKWGVGRLKVVS